MPFTMSYGAPAPVPEKPAAKTKRAPQAAKSAAPSRRDALKNKAEALFDPASAPDKTDAG